MFFKQTLLSVSALAALTMTAGAADMPAKAPRVAEQPQQVSGYVELYGGWVRSKRDETRCDPGDCETFRPAQANGWALGGAGRATWWWAPNYSLQLDAQGEGTSYKRTGNNNGFFQRESSHAYLIGGHANWRDPGRGLIGVFGGAGDATHFWGSGSVRHGLVGGEAQLYWGPVTLYGQGGYNTTLGDISSDNFQNMQAWFARGTARVYINPNFRLEGTVLYADGDMGFADPAVSFDFQTWLWRAKAEYKFATSPFAIFAVYEGSRTKLHAVAPPFTSDLKMSDNRVMAGLRLYLNENTLQFNDRSGTTLDIIAPFNVPSFIMTPRSTP
ncbi:MAG TPA: hypothetical protein VFB68_10965 [Xanthobacteraceae bacterium]|nr:hypothetical protein [Xanthobacteraceae bacterium]